ncbi:flocculation protein FLO11 isoform X2 [Sphaeramia orbicularis]|uniref:flocculation protein FLO11 isoform X2 n=1 Tax=Sphaeramia orbicularis TaxID=375764 RepID=UPI00117CA160|nr:flocculation protein FLO11-like isoform X2 [Sphaeramia orbicularis]
MARPGRPASESYQPVCCSVSQSVSYSSETGIVGVEDDDEAPIFSLSKSSMDVVMGTGQPHKRDPAWSRLDLRRSSSTNTHPEQNSVTHQHLYPNTWQHANSPNNQVLLTKQNLDLHNPPALSERWITNMQRWSGCSSSTHSRSSTPETVVWRGTHSRPWSLTQEAAGSVTPDSPVTKASPSPTIPPFISPLHSPTLPLVDVFSSPSPSPYCLSTHLQEDLPLPAPLPLPSPLQNTSPPLSNPANLLHMEDDGFPESQPLSFTFPSPVPSSVSLGKGGLVSHPGGLVEGQESGRGPSVCYLELPGQNLSMGRSWKTPLVSSLSDSHLGNCCRCSHSRESNRAANIEVIREEGTMTSQVDLVDAAVQTVSPVASWSNLRKNVSNSIMGSHSLLGSPPGSRLNLRCSVGSHSNLVSPSSSMFPASSGEDDREYADGPLWDENLASYHDLYRKRSCLKNHGGERDELGRRSSMKQVQWDEEGMTWDIHGASVEPEVLVSAIKKHLELKITEEPKTPQLVKRSSKKKKAPKPPVSLKVVDQNAPAIVNTSSCGLVAGGEVKKDAVKERKQEEGGKKDGVAESVRKVSKTDGHNTREDKRGEEMEVLEEAGAACSESPSHGSGHSRKRNVIRSLRRPGWCGGSRKADD